MKLRPTVAVDKQTDRDGGSERRACSRRGIKTAARCEDWRRKSSARCRLPVRFALQYMMDLEAPPPGQQIPPPAPLRACSESAAAEH
ncbi:hypothetical protein MHYP_G00265220 [Metynnis hypsauchen]